MANELVEILKSFNRKERYWVIQHAFRDQVSHLHPLFWQELETALPGKLAQAKRENAWWGFDYHLDWLIGAIHAYASGERNLTRPNDFIGSDGKSSKLVMGQQEDIDFVVAVGTTIILIEAKAFGAWSNEQLERKLRRLTVLEEIATQSARPLSLHLLLMSPRKPLRLRDDLPWPKWALDAEGNPIHIELKVDSALDLLAIEVCNATGKTSKSGDHFQVGPIRGG